jgi:ribonuclease HI
MLPGGKIVIGESIDLAIERLLFSKFHKGLDYYVYDVKSYIKSELDIVVVYYYVNATKDMINISKSNEKMTWQKLEMLDKNKLHYTVNLIQDGLTTKKVVENTTKITEVKLFTDGGSRGNPGPSALGFVIFDLEENVVKKGSKYLGITTNNQAEYQAVKIGLENCLELGADKVEVYMDSQLVANQMNGIYKIKNRDLWPIHQAIKLLIGNFNTGVTFTYIPRSYNQDADAMVNFELDNYEKSIKNKV